MGTDIHGVFQRHDAATDKWVDVPSNYEQDRHYQLFAVLAGVRNGFGFAGVKTGDPVEPIADRRGLPDDFVMDGDAHPIASLDFMDPGRRKYHGDDEPLEVWMGDHSHSWLTGEEILAWAEKAPTVTKTGYLTREVYANWDGKSAPESYCGDSWGLSIVKINDNEVERRETPNWTHIRCEWECGLKQDLAYFFDEVARLVSEHSRIRFVFGFDS